MIAFTPRTVEDWEPYQEIITHLYSDENETLKAVQKFMEANFNFKARYVALPVQDR
jgi:hypothetical protein